jgi:PAS domain S-box-containing protein
MGDQQRPIRKSEKAMQKRRPALIPARMPTDSAGFDYFKDIAGTIREPLVVLDKDLRVLSANRSFYHLFKVKQQDTVGTLIYDLGNRQWDIPALRSLLETILPEKAVFNDFEVEHDFPFIGKRVLLLNARRIPKLPKEARWILLAIEDISDRKSQEKALHASEEHFHEVFETTDDGLLLIEKISGMIVESNQSAENTLGYSKKSLKKKYLWELGILKDEQHFMQIAVEIRKNHIYKWLDKMIPNRRGGKLHADVYMKENASLFQCNIHDISERKLSEESLRDLARFPLENPNPVLRVSRSGKLLFANEAASVMLENWKLKVGKPVPSVIKVACANVFKTDKPKIVESTCGDRIFSVDIQPSPTKHDVNVYGRDITLTALAEDKNWRQDFMLQHVNEAIITSDLKLRLISWNKAAEKMYGWKAEEVLGQNTADVFLTKWSKGDFKEMRKTIASQGHWKGEVTQVVKDGSGIAVEMSTSVLQDSKGQKVGFVRVNRDITEQKLLLEKLTSSEVRYRRLFEAARDGILILDAKTGKILDVNPFLVELLGFTPAEFHGKKVWELGFFKDNIANETKFRELQKKDILRYDNLPLRTKDGRQIEVEFVSNIYQVNHLKVIQCNIRDITERKLAERSLIESEKLFSKAFRSSPIAITITNQLNGNFIEVNNAWCNIYGFTAEEAIGHSPMELSIVDDETRQRIIDELKKKDILANVELSLKDKTSNFHTILFSSENVNIAGEPCALSTGIDITERKLFEEKLKDTLDELKRSNTELEQFAYVASHDLQEPLRMVTNYLQLLDRRYKGKLDQDADEFIGFAVDGANRMHELINDLLTLSRVGTRTRKFVAVSCENILDQAMENLRVTILEKHAEVTYDPLPEVMADEIQLVQLFQNLIGNAIKFNEKRIPRIHIFVEEKPKEWIFGVRDNGIGIDPKYADRIFIIYQHLNPRYMYAGTGIGLAICKKIVQRHGGRIWVESKPGKGATFFFTLPKTKENPHDRSE